MARRFNSFRRGTRRSSAFGRRRAFGRSTRRGYGFRRRLRYRGAVRPAVRGMEVKVVDSRSVITVFPTDANLGGSPHAPQNLMLSADTMASAATATTPGRYAFFSKPWCLTYCGQGVGVDQRIGLSLQPRSLVVRVLLGAASIVDTSTYPFPDGPAGEGDLETSASNFVRTTYRIVVFRDREGTGERFTAALAPTWDTLFSTTIGQAPSVSNFLRVDNANRFQIAADRVVTVDADDPQRQLSLAIPVRGLNLRYASADATSMRSGHFYVIVLGEIVDIRRTVAGTSPVYVNGGVFAQWRMTYTDA